MSAHAASFKDKSGYPSAPTLGCLIPRALCTHPEKPTSRLRIENRATRECSAPFELKKDENQITVVLDPAGTIDESDEKNNVGSRLIK